MICLNFKAIASENAYIVYKIDGKIITNIDIENEKNYLLALNSQLQSLDASQLLNVSKQSIIKENIKEKEILKFFKLEQTDPYIDSFIKDLYLRLELNNEIDLREYLDNFNLNLTTVKKKIEIEIFWNRLVFEKFKNQININEKLINQKIDSEKELIDKKMFQLSEIILPKKNDIELDTEMKKILESINEIGFKNTASLYSISDSSKLGGDIGWVGDASLSSTILKELNKINIGDYTDPIVIGPNFLILKIESIKFEKKETDKAVKYKQMVKFETNRQLEQFSKMYFNRIKINANINEL